MRSRHCSDIVVDVSNKSRMGGVFNAHRPLSRTSSWRARAKTRLLAGSPNFTRAHVTETLDDSATSDTKRDLTTAAVLHFPGISPTGSTTSDLSLACDCRIRDGRHRQHAQCIDAQVCCSGCCCSRSPSPTDLPPQRQRHSSGMAKSQC